MDPLRVSLFALILLTVSRFHGVIGLAALRPALLLAMAVAVYAFLNPRTLNQRALVQTWPAKVMIAMAMMACVSVPFAISVGGSAAFILFAYSKTLIIAFLLIVAVRDAKDLRFFVLAYVVSCGILVVLAVTAGVSKVQGVQGYDANDVALVLLVGLPLTLMILQTTRSKAERGLTLLVLLGIGVVLAWSRSRGGFIGLMAVGLALLFLLKRVSVPLRLGFVGVVVLTLAVAAPADYWETMRSITNPQEDYNWSATYGRKHVWERGMGYMISRPLTGLGIGNFPRAEGTISDPAMEFVDAVGVRLKWSSAHNSFVQAGAELGIPGLVLFCMLVFGGIAAMVRLRRRVPAAWARGDPEQRFIRSATLYIPVALVAFASAGFFLSFAWHDPIYILSAYMAGLYAAVNVKRGQLGSLPPPESAWRLPNSGWRVPAAARPAHYGTRQTGSAS